MNPICPYIIFQAIGVGYYYNSDDDMDASNSDSGFVDDGDVTTEYSDDDDMDELDEEDEMEYDAIDEDENLPDGSENDDAPESVYEHEDNDESDDDLVAVGNNLNDGADEEERNMSNDEIADDNNVNINDSDVEDAHEDECFYISGRCVRHPSPSLLEDIDDDMRIFLETEANPMRFRIRRSSSTVAIASGPEVDIIEVVDLVTSESEDEDS